MALAFSNANALRNMRAESSTSPYAMKAANDYSRYSHRNSGNGLPFIIEQISNYVLLLLKFLIGASNEISNFSFSISK